MDRIVNVRLNADLAQAIQQFTQLDQVVTRLSTNMSGLGGGMGMGGGFGGMGGGMGGIGNPVGGLGGGLGAPGVVTQMTGVAPPRSQNRSPAVPGGSAAGGGGYTHPGITSQMFGLAQIGFALEDYQYAGWRGVMNNVPWIANALGNMAGSAIGVAGLGSAMLLGTAIGVPLANAAYESLSPETLDAITKAFGGLGASTNDIRGMRSDRLQNQLSRTSSLNFRSVQMEQDLARARMLEGGAAEAKAFFYEPFRPEVSRETRAGFSEGMDEFRRRGGTAALNADMKSEFSKDLAGRARNEMNDWYDNSSTIGSWLGSSWNVAQAASASLVEGKSFSEEFTKKEMRFFEEKANAQITDAYKQAIDKVGEAIQSGDKKKLEDAIKIPVLPDSVRRRLRELLRSVTKAEAEARRDKADAEVMAEEDQLFADAEEGRMGRLGKLEARAASNLENMAIDQAEGRRGGAIAGERFSSQIAAIIRGAKTGVDAAANVEQFLRSQGVDENKIGSLVTQDFQQGVQDAKDSRPKGDENMWNAYSAQWIAAVRSDILQANAASWKNGKFNVQVFNTYAARIKQRISDDLGKAGITRANRQQYAKMIWDAAYQAASETYEDAQKQGIAQMEAAGVRNINPGMANMAAMQNMVGEMSNDLTAVYGVTNSNAFMMQRMYDQQLRRKQIMMSRFQR